MAKNQKKLDRVEGLIHSAAGRPVTLYHMIWGRIKSGKTRYIGSGPDPIIFAAEDGAMVLRDHAHIQLFPVNKKGLWVPPKWDHAWDFVHYLRYGDHDYKTVGIDTMSALVRVGMRFINEDEEARDDARAPGTTDQRTYGRLATLITEWVEELAAVCRSQGIHLILTAQTKNLKGDRAEEEGSTVVPDFIPSILGFITQAPDIISHSFIEEIEQDEGDAEEIGVDEPLRYGQVFRDPDLYVGERVTPIGATKPWLPRYAYNVTIPKIVRRIERKAKSGKTT